MGCESWILGFNSISAIHQLGDLRLTFSGYQGLLGFKGRTGLKHPSQITPILECFSITSLQLTMGNTLRTQLLGKSTVFEQRFQFKCATWQKNGKISLMWILFHGQFMIFLDYNQTALFQNIVICINILFILKLCIKLNTRIKFLYTRCHMTYLNPENTLFWRKWLFSWIKTKMWKK